MEAENKAEFKVKQPSMETEGLTSPRKAAKHEATKLRGEEATCTLLPVLK